MNASPVILVVDDEKPLRSFVRRSLEIHGFIPLVAANGLEALAIFNVRAVDLVILDVRMPYMDGLETIRRIRQTSLAPIIVLASADEDAEKLRALNLGADDFLIKPFGSSELLARVQAVFRRARWVETPGEGRTRLIRGDIVADLERHEVTVRGKLIELTPTEFNLLVYLIENTGRVLPHQTILEQVWGPEYGPEREYLRVYVNRLRQKLEADPARPRYLVTQPGAGYLFADY